MQELKTLIIGIFGIIGPNKEGNLQVIIITEVDYHPLLPLLPLLWRQTMINLPQKGLECIS